MEQEVKKEEKNDKDWASRTILNDVNQCDYIGNSETMLWERIVVSKKLEWHSN